MLAWGCRVAVMGAFPKVIGGSWTVVRAVLGSDLLPRPLAGEGWGEGECSLSSCASFVLVAPSLLGSLPLLILYFPEPGSAPRRRSHFHLSCQMKVTKAKAFMRQNSLRALRARRSDIRRKSVLGEVAAASCGAAAVLVSRSACLFFVTRPRAGEGWGEGECSRCSCAPFEASAMATVLARPPSSCLPIPLATTVPKSCHVHGVDDARLSCE